MRIVIQNASVLKDIVPQDERLVLKEMLQHRVESIDGFAKALADIRGQLIDRMQEIDSGSSDLTA